MNVRTVIEQLLLEDQFLDLGIQPIRDLPKLLSLTDLIVIQTKSPVSIGQTPAKVFDAMAMAKPIIGTSTSELPEILKGCCWIVEPGNIKQLPEAIQYILDHPLQSKEMGWKV
jgi:glycosyltransferase involved in cell wall biosynthesis